MSIEVRKKKESNSSSFGITVKVPELKSKSTAIKIDTKKTNIEKKKEEKMEKKKPEIKFFYELLEESWHKGIRNRGHTSIDDHDGPNTYYCPICCVCELLGILKIGPNERTRMEHEEMIQMLRGKTKFIDATVCVNYRDVPIKDSYWDHDMMQYENNEPLLAFSLASSFHVQGFNNLKLAHFLKEQLYDHKPLPKEEPKRELYAPHIKFEVLGAKRLVSAFDNISLNAKDLELEMDPTTSEIRWKKDADR